MSRWSENWRKFIFNQTAALKFGNNFRPTGDLPAFVISSFVVLGKDGQTKELQVMGRIGNLNEFEYIQKVVEKLYHGNLLLPWTDAGKAELKKAEEKWEASPEGKAAAEADKKAALMPKPLTGLAKVRAEKAKAEADKQAAALKAELVVGCFVIRGLMKFVWSLKAVIRRQVNRPDSSPPSSIA